MNLLTEIEVKKIITDSVKQVYEENDTKDFSEGKLHHHFSKAFVAGIGRQFSRKYAGDEFVTKFQDYKEGKIVSGEWLFDAVVVKRENVELKDKILNYSSKVIVALESELAPGEKAFFDDFTKLLVVNAEKKIYINGIKNIKQKEKYISERMNLINSILKIQTENSSYIICFVDYPSFWKNDEIFVRIIEI